MNNRNREPRHTHPHENYMDHEQNNWDRPTGERKYQSGNTEYQFGDRNNQENWDDFASDRDRYISNGNEHFRDSRRRGYERGNDNGIYGRDNGYPNRVNSMDTGRNSYPIHGGSSSHGGTYYNLEDNQRRADAYSENWSGSSWNPANNAQRGNFPGSPRSYDKIQEHTTNRNNRFSGVASRKNR